MKPLTSFDLKLRKKLIDTFRYLVTYLEGNDYTWFCAFGTAIGAVRHNGLIPWDDDIDIFMPRKDYNRFLQSTQLINSDYSVISIQDPKYYLPFAKIYNNKTTLWEQRQYEILTGVYIDIFPLDEFNYSNNDFDTKYNQYFNKLHAFQNSLATYSVANLVDDLKEKHPGAVLMNLSHKIKTLFTSTHKYHKDFLEVNETFNEEQGDSYVSLSGVYGKREIYPKEWFSGYTSFKFEDFQVRLPLKYHEYLTQVYGNYMQLPPEYRQVPHHSHYYINLNERLDLDEIHTRINKGIHTEY